MDTIKLLYSTGDDQADTILRGIIGVWESVFPDRIRGYYLTGSYSDGSATTASDLDLYILFKNSYLGTSETDKAQQLCEYCESISPIVYVDMGYLSEERVQQADRVSDALRLKFSSRLLYGEDSRDRIAATPDARYVRDAMHIPYYGSKFGRPDLDVLTFPLDYPDPQGEFYGYDGWTFAAGDSPEQAGTKMLVVIVGRIATALIALRTGLYVGNKRESATLYRAHINDEWTMLVEQVYTLCKKQWGYRVPTKVKDRSKLRELCQQAIAFENAFFSLYRDYLLKELHAEESEDRRRAVERLGQIIYPSQDVLDALKAFEHDDNADMRGAAQAAAQTWHQTMKSLS
jgi:hypothetical protein